MTDKQIIIDNADVSECESFCNGVCCKVGFGDDASCKLFSDCHYKNWQRKEQECEELKEELHKNFEEKDILHLIIDRLLEASSYDTNTASAEDFEDVYEHMRYEQQQLDQLKAENNKYALFIEKLCDYAGLECESEEQAMRTLSDLASQMNKARWIIDRLKQTLTEIKKIVENGKRFAEGYMVTGEQKTNVLTYANAILQKISEVEK